MKSKSTWHKNGVVGGIEDEDIPHFPNNSSSLIAQSITLDCLQYRTEHSRIIQIVGFWDFKFLRD